MEVFALVVVPVQNMVDYMGRGTDDVQIESDDSIELPSHWDHSDGFMNVNYELLDARARRIVQQCTFHHKPLGLAVCYGCGHLLWSCVDGGHTFLVNKPSGMSDDEAPASAYLRAVPSCTAGFVYTERGIYQLKSGGIHVPFVSLTPFHPFSMLDVLDPSGNVKPVEWDIKDTVSSQPV